MYTFYYPENNKRFSNDKELEFKTAQEAIDYWISHRSMWQEIKTTNTIDKAAFMSPSNGDIVVVRQLTEPMASSKSYQTQHGDYGEQP